MKKVIHISIGATQSVAICTGKSTPLTVPRQKLDEYLKTGNFKLCKKCHQALMQIKPDLKTAT
jgi:hypothetical protein